MRALRPMIVLLLLLAAASGQAQKESGQARAVAQPAPQPALSAPTAFRVTEGDLKLTLAVLRVLAAGQHEQVQKMLMENHVSLPQFERNLQTACLLSAERHMEQAAQKSAEPTAGTHAVTIDNLQEVQSQLKANLERQFGGRGSNYKESRALADREQATVDEICTLVAKSSQGAK
jgi:uncharacterized lipoprotein YajG